MGFITYQKQYQIRTGLLEVKLKFEASEYGLDLSFDVIKDIELSYGYEDDNDLLVFYPNLCSFTFDDFDKQNYLFLKLSLSQYQSSLPAEQFNYGGVEVRLNGVLKFKGTIDPLSLRYSSKYKSVSFDAVDLIMPLKDIAVNRDTIYINPYTNEPLADNLAVPLNYPIYGIFRQVWGNDMSAYVYDVNSVDIPGLYGIFLKHDWLFKGERIFPYSSIIKDWSSPEGFISTCFHFDSMGVFSNDRPCPSCYDFLRLMALQFGAIIGVADYGKVYFYKRFGLHNVPPIDLSSQYLKIDRGIWHDIVRGVVVRNHWNGERSYEFGEIERNGNGEYLYKNRVIELDTYVGSFGDPAGGGSNGTCIYIPPDYAVFGKVWDPQFGGEAYAAHAYQLVARWYQQNRRALKELIELELTGIDYSMAKIYSVLPHGFSEGHRVKFRPMTMSKNLMKNTTKMAGLEI